MTDKQIIIDGVDITNCIHRATNKLCGDIDPYCRCYTGSCNDISNCYFKQLKRKEQECEELGQAYLETNELLQEKTKECTNLKAENEELEKINKANAKSYEKHWYKLEKYKQTLTEIKEIAQYDVYTPHTDLCIKLNWIKKKISEVENDESNT